MYIDGDVLELDIEMDLEEVKTLQLFIQDRLNYIGGDRFIAFTWWCPIYIRTLLVAFLGETQKTFYQDWVSRIDES